MQPVQPDCPSPVAKGLGMEDLITVINASPDKPGFMEGKLLVTKLVAHRKTVCDSRRSVYRAGQCEQADRPVGHGHSGALDGLRISSTPTFPTRLPFRWRLITLLPRRISSRTR